LREPRPDQPRERFQFRSLDDVAVDGWVVIPTGSLGEGEVMKAEPAGSNGHPAKIKLQFDWIYGADNLKIRLSDVPEANRGDGQKGTAATATIASSVLLGPIGLFAHNFVRGKDAIVTPDQEIKVYVAQTVHVISDHRLNPNDGFAHEAAFGSAPRRSDSALAARPRRTGNRPDGHDARTQRVDDGSFGCGSRDDL
jgi:hypothetical protein